MGTVTKLVLRDDEEKGRRPEPGEVLIVSHIPIPPVRQSPIQEALTMLDVGESFEYPNEKAKPSTVSAWIGRAIRKNPKILRGREFAIRRVDEEGRRIHRIWRIK